MSELAVIDAETGELIQPPSNLFRTTDPHQMVVRAKQHADELALIIKEQQLYRVIGQKAHVFVEAWTLLGSMLGVFPVLDGEIEPVEVDGVTGFRATVKAVTLSGEVVGRASGYCMRDEPTWKNRPLHAVAAMAETRATSRALRKPLGFIVQLAGYSPTAAEEMPPGQSGAAASPPQPQSPPDVAGLLPPQYERDVLETMPGEEDLPDALKSGPTDPISKEQRDRLWAIHTDKEMPIEVLREIVLEYTGQDSTRKIERREYQAVSDAFEAWQPPEALADKTTRVRLTKVFREKGFTTAEHRKAYARGMLKNKPEDWDSSQLTQTEAEFLITFLEAREDTL